MRSILKRDFFSNKLNIKIQERKNFLEIKNFMVKFEIF